MRLYWLIVMSKKTLLYISGIPGAGKTALLNGALADTDYTVDRLLFQKRIYAGGVMLGGDRLSQRLNQPNEALFSGTDALQRHVQPKAIGWFKDCPYTAVVGEGDRLSNRSFFEGVMEQGWTVKIIILNCPLDLAMERQIKRGYRVTDQRFKIACTKVSNIMGLSLVSQFYDARLPLPTLIGLLRQNPILKQIRGTL